MLRNSFLTAIFTFTMLPELIRYWDSSWKKISNYSNTISPKNCGQWKLGVGSCIGCQLT